MDDAKPDIRRPQGTDAGDGTRADPSALTLGFPRIASRVVPRPSLIARLDRLCPVSIIEALPGFGKTTLAAAWGKHQLAKGTEVAWIQIPPGVDSPSGLHEVLHRHLVRSQILPSTSAATRTSNDLPAWVSDLAHANRPIVIIIDEAQTMPRLLASTLCEIVAAAPTLHLLACCAPGHALHEASAGHQIASNVITGADLAIHAAQIPEYADAWGHSISIDTAQELHDYVGGWLSPLQLVLDTTPHWSDTLATNVARQYVFDHVLDKVPEALAQPMARIAVPQPVDLDLADRLLGNTGSSAAIDAEHLTNSLQHLGLLWTVPHKDPGIQWRYPNLLRRVLVDSLEADDPATARLCHRETAHSLVDRGDMSVRDLLRHARIGRDWALLAALWAENGWCLMGSPEFEFAYDRLPESAIRNHPSLALARAIAHGMAITPSEAWAPRTEITFFKYVEAAQQELQRSSATDGSAEHADLLVASMIGERSMGRFDRATALAAQALRRHHGAKDNSHGGPRTVQTAWLQLQVGITRWLKGDQAATLEHATNSYEIAPRTIVGSGAAGLLAAIHTTAGDPDAARRWLACHDAVDLFDHWAAGLARLPAALAKAMLALDRLDAAAAEEALADAPLGYDASGLWPLVLFVHTRYALLFGEAAAMLSRINHVHATFDRHLRHRGSVARQLFDRCTSDLMLSLGQLNRVEHHLSRHEDTPWLCVPTARLHLMTGDSDKANKVASSSLWRTDMNGRDRAHLCILKATALHATGHHMRARAAFRQAGSYMEHTRDVEPWLALPVEQRRELLNDLEQPVAEPIRSRLANARQLYPDDAQFVTISPREREIVKQMHRHRTAADIARELSVSVNTVRKQLVAIYAKLGVHDRDAAIMRARSLGILDQPCNEPACT